MNHNEDYSYVDPILYPWAQKYGFRVHTTYKGDDVRSVDVPGKSGKLYQLWLDVLDGHSIQIHAWDYQTKRTDIPATALTLAYKLDEVYASIQSWDLEFAAELHAFAQNDA